MSEDTMLKRIKKLIGYGEADQYVRQHFFDSNIRSSFYMTVVVIILELWMLASLIKVIVVNDGSRTVTWIVQHGVAYITLLGIGVALFVYACMYIKGKNPPRYVGNILIKIFSAVGVVFGIYIAYLDYMKGEQVLAFTMMIIYVFGLFAWHPLTSFILTSASFLLFYIIINNGKPATYATQVNLFTVWVAVVMVSISIFNQKLKDSRKQEQLDNINKRLTKISVTDDLTGIPNMHDFRISSKEYMQKVEDITSMRFLFLDIVNFKALNERYGFREGTEFLKAVALKIQDLFEGFPAARISDDHFAVFTDVNGMDQKLDELRSYIKGLRPEIYTGLNVGACAPNSRDYSSETACDRARYACNTLKDFPDRNFREYDDDLRTEFNRRQYIVNHIDESIAHGDIKVYYQPVMWSKDKKLCGLEALARWDDADYGFLSPGLFIPVLEEYRLIHKLDCAIIDIVLKDLKQVVGMNKKTVPVSINFSRLDFELTDIIGFLEEKVKAYDIPKDLIHVEITESALEGGRNILKDSLERLRELGYGVWLDDFGAGYSALNALKDYEFDVVKVDMDFLKGFYTNEKTKTVLNSVINMSKEIGMRTLAEGVETKEMADFLDSIGCERQQGYYFGKPMTKQDIGKRIDDGIYVIEEEL